MSFDNKDDWWRAQMRRQRKESVRLRRRVEALEKALYGACLEKVTHGHTATIIAASLKLEVPGVRELLP